MTAEPPERDAFFLHWEASMMLDLGSYLVGLEGLRSAEELLGLLIAHQWPGRDKARAETVRHLALEHLRHEQRRVAAVADYAWLPVAIWGSAATRAAKTAAQCMEVAWLDARDPDWHSEPLLDLDQEVAELIKHMKDSE